MNWYSEYKGEWKEIIETVSSETKRNTLMVEKDTIQTMFLNEAIDKGSTFRQTKTEKQSCRIASV